MAEEHNALKYGPPISKAASVAAGGGYGDVGVSRLSETLTPIMDLWQRPEWALLRGEILFARALTSPAVALRFSSIEIINPAASTKLAVIREIGRSGGGVGTEVSIDLGTALAANPVTNRGIAMDARWPVFGETSICTLVTGDLAAVATNLQFRFGAGVARPQEMRWPFILRPGSKLFLVADTANSAIFHNIYFSEREAFPGELQARG